MDRPELLAHLGRNPALATEMLRSLVDKYTEIYGSSNSELSSIVTYSGPRNAVTGLYGRAVSKKQASEPDLSDKNKPKTIHPPTSNAMKALELAKLLSASRIDDTSPGYRIFKVWKLYETVKEIEPVQELAVQIADEVAGQMSVEFIRAARGRLFTSVCGAGRDRVFMKNEIPEILRNDKITHINQRDIGFFHDRLKKKFGPGYLSEPSLVYQEQIFKDICLAELDFKKSLATRYPTFATAIDYQQSRELFLIDQSLPRMMLTTEHDRYFLLGHERGPARRRNADAYSMLAPRIKKMAHAEPVEQEGREAHFEGISLPPVPEKRIYRHSQKPPRPL